MTDGIEPRLTRAPESWPAAPRLLALRLQGFKSFAERTNVEFGGGISAVVGPNGSGKSNLADALRWALGEQGRALRSRKAEDVIWAGSEKRSAQGMADVTLVLDNADGLLPVDFQVLELGRRLFRSGENEYLLNKQRIRLRDLVDLLDGAHLADNAFLFIGQGMVDQALALRPEERRPLFEEVAGVRRHERRRRKAEEQLIESEANLARVDDILAELRPQARRLAAQAEQQTTRSSIGDELATALLAATHARWHEASARLADAGDRRTRAQADADRAMARARRGRDRGIGGSRRALRARRGRTRPAGRPRDRPGDADRAAVARRAVGRRPRGHRARSDAPVGRAFDRGGRDRRAAPRHGHAHPGARPGSRGRRHRSRSGAGGGPGRAGLAADRVTGAGRAAGGAPPGRDRPPGGDRDRSPAIGGGRAPGGGGDHGGSRGRGPSCGDRRPSRGGEDFAGGGGGGRVRGDQAARESARAALETADAERAAAANALLPPQLPLPDCAVAPKALPIGSPRKRRRPIARAARKAGGRRLDEDLAWIPS